MMRIPEISVIMPAYNHEKFIGEAIRSVLAQTFEDFELIIINDGSTDRTEAVIKQFDDPRILFYSQENRGSSCAHNRGLQIARGEFISIINSDDIYHQERLEILYKEAKNNKLKLVISDIALIDQDSAVINNPDHWWIKWHEYLKAAYLASESPDRALLAGNYTISTSNFFFNASIVKEIGLFRPYRYILDYDFAFRAARSYPDGFKFLYDKKLLYYRLHGKNAILTDPLVANNETFSFLINATKEVLGENACVPIDHLNKIKRYITKELSIGKNSVIARLNDEMKKQAREIEQKSRELELRSRYNQRLADELYSIRSSLSFKLGGIITYPLKVLRDKAMLRNTAKPFNISVVSMAELNSRLEKIINAVDVVSFDIFDTLFERDIEPPDKVKEAVARCIADMLKYTYDLNLSHSDLLELRSAVERQLRQQASSAGKDYECRYSDIVREMVMRILGRYDEDLFSQIIEKEIEVENEVLYVKEGIVELIERLKSNGKRVIAISDMYLDKEHIHKIMKSKSIDHLFDNVYMSSEMSLCKYSGRLFKLVLAKENILPRQLLHIGDTRTSDHKVPLKLGIGTIRFVDKEHLRKKYILKAYNKLAASNAYWRGRHLLQLIRLPDKKGDYFYNYGFSFLGPVYATFIYGVIGAVKKHQIKNVFFIAREGELFLRLFKIIAPHFLKESEMPETKYACLTRKSTALASVYKGLSHEKAMIALYNPKQEGLYSIFNVFGLPQDRLSQLTEEHGFNEIKKPIYDWNDKRLKSLLLDDRFQSKVIACARKDRRVLEKYLTQMGFFNDHKIAFVDVGWNATIQKFLQDAFMGREDYPHIYGLYLGFRDGIHQNIDGEKNTILGVLYDKRRHDPTEQPFSRFEELFEEAARAAHPTTIGYREDLETGVVEPIFKDSNASDRIAELLHNEKIEQVQRAVVDFSKEFIRAVKLTGYSFEEIKPFILTLVERCVVFPTAEEVNQLMNLTHAEDFGCDNIMDFNADRIDSLKTVFYPPKLLNKIKRSNWSYGTARSSRVPGINLLVRVYELLRGHQWG
jgi:predicted HAD superfamily hydrolase/glycosyltransferase involved in cell wall biosynthesis